MKRLDIEREIIYIWEVNVGSKSLVLKKHKITKRNMSEGLRQKKEKREGFTQASVKPTCLLCL